MLRKENLPAFSAIWFLISISIAYTIGHFISPNTTTTSAGLLGWDSKEITYFNAYAFLITLGACLLVSPILQLIRGQRIWGVMELVLIPCMIGGGWWLSATLFSEEEGSGFLWVGSYTTTQFDQGILLVALLGIWGTMMMARHLLGPMSGRKKIVRMLWLALAILAVGLYFLGMHRSIFHSTKFWVFEESVSLIDSVTAFFKAGEAFLGVVIITFTLIFPMVKFIYMFWGILASPTKTGMRITKILSVLGKYSMLDVFVVALLILNLKFESEVIDMEIREGAILFGLSIILNMIVTSALVLAKVEKLEEAHEQH
jgi:paraquat-inducible protein A